MAPGRPRARAGRTARATVEVWTLTVLAHTVAGGELPGLPWLVGIAGLVAGATAWALRRQSRPSVLAPALAACQLGLHLLFASLGPAGHAGHHTHEAAALTPRMLAAHVVCAVLTAVVWWVRRSVVEVVLRLAQPLVVATNPASRATGVHGRPGKKVWLVGAPGRAPPWVLALT